MANAILAAILSLIISGLGQVYAGDIKRGVIIFVVAIIIGVVLNLLFGNPTINVIVGCLYNIYAAYDAYKVAQG